MSDELTEQVRALGKGMVQANLRLNRILERLDVQGGGPVPASAQGPSPLLDLLFDLCDGLDRADAAVAALALPPPQPPPRRAWPWSRLRALSSPQPTRPAEVLAGLRLLRAELLDGLARQGVFPVPVDGAFDPSMHRAVAVLPAGDPACQELIASSSRRGFLLRDPGGARVLRPAEVTVFQATKEETDA